MAYNFSKKLKEDAERYNITPRDYLFLQLVADGTDKGDAYTALYNHGAKVIPHEQARSQADDWIQCHPGAAICLQKMKTKLKGEKLKEDVKPVEEVDEEEVKKFTDKSFILAQYVKILPLISGKERADVLTKIADLQRMKQEETKEKEEVRKFYLPWVSHCRTCEVLQVVRSFLDAMPR